jgi:apolipoprotein N-acyltransferase
MRRLLTSRGVNAAMMMMAAPFVWVATELGRTHLLTGFPWVLLGYSQATTLPIAQLASVFGVYGVSALVASVSAAAACCIASRSVRYRVQAVGAVAVLLTVTAVWGSRRAAQAEWTREGQAVTIGLVQGNASEAQRRDAAGSRRVLEDQVRMTRQAIGSGADLVIWSESSMSPYRLDDGSEMAGLVRRVAIRRPGQLTTVRVRPDNVCRRRCGSTARRRGHRRCTWCRSASSSRSASAFS